MAKKWRLGNCADRINTAGGRHFEQFSALDFGEHIPHKRLESGFEFKTRRDRDEAVRNLEEQGWKFRLF